MTDAVFAVRRASPVTGLAEGKSVLVTGGASGIGRAASLQFAAQGAAHVTVADRDLAGARGTAEAIAAAGGAASAVLSDLTDEADVAALADGVVAATGRIDAAFNNAGVSDAISSFHELDMARWNRMIAANLTSVFLCMKHELRHMSAAGSGSIVNTSSGAGIVAAPGLPHYTAAKHGVVGLTKAAAQEYARSGIRVNALLPGATDTPMIRGFIGDDANLAKMIAGSNIHGRLLTAEEVAAAAVWLASDAAAMVNGQSLVVDGGGLVR